MARSLSSTSISKYSMSLLRLQTSAASADSTGGSAVADLAAVVDLAAGCCLTSASSGWLEASYKASGAKPGPHSLSNSPTGRG
eukprot:CAMPEP_0197679120 /NCGR_PEP_ID=MMETSP1338-20131121/91152_1 /TAXON_ID=43686 ORGANISM="Pelagodinium beii, Strain RCC1491" /NCGR_SAMPLE_ID=MMETSP1338 /ASSEMBLY_ACC=CAM_ASM_000754 /LENGTH=82 /DNA_ID=CAMNT_0043260143 /DNA_START=280 /DNA_END=528 /DNA_ORIENTATION=+